MLGPPPAGFCSRPQNGDAAGQSTATFPPSTTRTGPSPAVFTRSSVAFPTVATASTTATQYLKLCILETHPIYQCVERTSVDDGRKPHRPPPILSNTETPWSQRFSYGSPCIAFLLAHRRESLSAGSQSPRVVVAPVRASSATRSAMRVQQHQPPIRGIRAGTNGVLTGVLHEPIREGERGDAD